MKPKLVNLNDIFKDKEKSLKISEQKTIKKVKVTDFKIDYNSIFNFSGLIIIFIGVFFLHKRKKEKEERKKNFEGRIHTLKNIIKNNDGFIL